MRRLALLVLLAGPVVSVGCTHASINPASLREPGVKRPRCHAARTIRRLSKAPQEKLDSLDVATSAVTTPFKKAGVQGWRDTGCNASVVGVPVRDVQRVSGDHYTLDLKLTRFEVDGKPGGEGRFLRIEIAPETKAQAVAAKTPITRSSTVSLAGPVVIDEDGPFLEVHPGADFRVVNPR